MEEQELTELCRQGDNRARKELYEQYAGRMLGICLRYAGDRETAQDLLHDGFLKIFGSFDKFTWRGEGSLRAWMERVMVNVALQYLRKNDVMSQSMALEDAPETYEEPDASEVEAIPQQVLMHFVEELPAGYRTVFNLYTFEDKSHKEIAQLLGINEKSSASQLFRAKTVLARKVKEWLMMKTTLSRYLLSVGNNWRRSWCRLSKKEYCILIADGEQQRPQCYWWWPLL